MQLNPMLRYDMTEEFNVLRLLFEQLTIIRCFVCTEIVVSGTEPDVPDVSDEEEEEEEEEKKGEEDNIDDDTDDEVNLTYFEVLFVCLFVCLRVGDDL